MRRLPAHASAAAQTVAGRMPALLKGFTMNTIVTFIRTVTVTAAGSVSVTIAPRDSRCRYWAKVVRAGAALPLPSAVGSASDIPGAYARRGEEELFAGDILIEGEENHPRKARGWTYWVKFMGADGTLQMVRDPGADEKVAMKAAGLPAELLPGSGQVAACVRLAHAVRLGIAYC